MDWSKRSRIRMAELSRDSYKIIESYQPTNVKYKQKLVSADYFFPIPPPPRLVTIGFTVEYKGKTIEYSIKNDICERIT